MSIVQLYTNFEVGEIPFPEYPRPQFVRDSYINLNGQWDYSIYEGEFSEWQGQILVPFSPESALSGVNKILQPNETLKYKREFTVDTTFVKDYTCINFGAVDYKCKIYINDILVGSHSGGFTSFSIDISSAIKSGQNTIEVLVTDPSNTSYQSIGKQKLSHHGIWYTPQSGIWQTVWIESMCKNHIERVELLPDIDNNELNIAVISKASEFNIVILDEETIIYSGKVSNIAKIKLENYELWSPEHPRLYDICISSSDDTITSYFGMRKFSTGLDELGVSRLFLNNKPYFHNGVLDQGYWPEGLLTPPSYEAFEFDIDKMKSMGFNMLRKHIKIEPQYWYYLCDKKGMLVWQDMINGGTKYNLFLIGAFPLVGIHLKDNKYKMFSRSDKEGRDEYYIELKDMITTLKNVVSIAMWVPFNEGWGQFDSVQATEFIKKLDTSRSIDSTSGWHDQGKSHSEFKSKHIYFTKIFFPKNDKRVKLLSEFGGYSFPLVEHMYNPNRYFGYKIYKKQEKFISAYTRLFKEQIVPYIDKGLSATVYTQLSDVEEETNGLLTYDRKVDKIDCDIVKEINSSVRINI